MKKSYYLIVLVLILGLVLTGCTLLSNISQVPATEQSGIIYLTKTVPSSDDLVGLWHFDGDALDSSGNDNHGTITGATDAGSANAMFGDALSFAGSDYVIVSDSATLDITDEITLEAWIKAPAGQTNGDAIVWKGGAYLIQYWNNRINAGVFTAGGWGGSSWLSTKIIFDDSWHHVALTYDGSHMRLYIDGGLDTTKAWTGNIITNENDLYFGCRTPATYLFTGVIDEVRIWDEALTSDQIQESFALGTAQPDATVVVELGQEFFGDEVVIFTSSFYELNGTCSDDVTCTDCCDTIDIYMMSNYGETISGVSERKKLYTPNGTEGCYLVVGTLGPGGTSISVEVGKDDCKSIHLSLDLEASGQSVGFNAQFLPYD